MILKPLPFPYKPNLGWNKIHINKNRIEFN